MANEQGLGFLQQQQQAVQQAQAATEGNSMQGILGLLQGLGSLGANIAGIATGTGEQGQALAAGARSSINAAAQDRKDAKEVLVKAQKSLDDSNMLDKRIQRAEKSKNPLLQQSAGESRVAFQGGDTKLAASHLDDADDIMKAATRFKLQDQITREGDAAFAQSALEAVKSGQLSPEEAMIGAPSRVKSYLGPLLDKNKPGMWMKILSFMAGFGKKEVAPQSTSSNSDVEKIRIAAATNPKAKAFMDANPGLFQQK